MRTMMLIFLTISLSACAGRATPVASLAVEAEAHIDADASIEEPRTMSRTLNITGDAGSADSASSAPGATKPTRPLCPIKCTRVIHGRLQAKVEGDTEFIALVQPAIEQLTGCDPSLGPAPMITLRFGQDGGLVAAGVDEDTARGEVKRCLHEHASRESFPSLSSLPGAIIHCREECGERRARKQKRSATPSRGD